MFRTLVSSQEPIKPVSKKPLPSKNADAETEDRTIGASAKRFPFSRRKKSKKPASADTDHTGLEAIRGLPLHIVQTQCA